MKEWLLPEDHGSQHAAQTPHVQTVVVHLIVHQQLRTLAVIVRSNNRRERGGVKLTLKYLLATLTLYSWPGW